MHLLETRYQRAFADRVYPEGAVASLKSLGLLIAASDARPLRLCAKRRPRRDRRVRRDHRDQPEFQPASQRAAIAPIAEAIRRGCRVALGVDASAFDEDDDILREMRLGHFLHGGWGFDKVIERGDWLRKIVADGRFANGAPGDGSLRVGEPADILVLDLDALDRDAVMSGRADRSRVCALDRGACRSADRRGQRDRA